MNKSINYIKSHNLVNRCYDMMYYFHFFKNKVYSKKEIKANLYDNLLDPEKVETMAKYFETKLKKSKKQIELKCNLHDLIANLNFLKQYLVNEL